MAGVERIISALRTIMRGIAQAAARFPVTVLCLVGAAGLIMYLISLHDPPPPAITKLIVTLLFGAVAGVAAQFAHERFGWSGKLRWLVHGITIILAVSYMQIIWRAPEFGNEIAIRTVVAGFAMVCAFLWFPSYGTTVSFNHIVLVHCIAAFTAALYAVVLSIGIASIIGAVNILLVRISGDAYAHAMVIIWLLFATVYYLSLLPRFNAEGEAAAQGSGSAPEYPKLLEIVVSYIAVPLVATYTLVLFLYFLKILITWSWPSGQLGPLVLGYSAVGLIVFVLAELLDNRFTVLYRKLFPTVLVPIVIMQLISVYIRLAAYGVTESRYYVTLFGGFTLFIAAMFSIKPSIKHGIIALLAGSVALISIVPPIDPFTVSRSSQISRLEAILSAEGILHDGRITPMPGASRSARVETTDILSYLQRRSYLEQIAWLPADFDVYNDLKATFGFEPTYPEVIAEDDQYFFAHLDALQPVAISGYDIMVTADAGRWREQKRNTVPLQINSTTYELVIERLSADDVKVAVNDAAGTELVSTQLFKFVDQLTQNSVARKDALAPEAMTLDTERGGYHLRIMFQSVTVMRGPGSEAGVDYSLQVMFGVPK